MLAVWPLTHLDGVREVLAQKRTERGFARAPTGLTPRALSGVYCESTIFSACVSGRR